MYYRLKDDFAFRGWIGLPYAIKNLEINELEPFFCNKEKFDVLIKCDGRTDIAIDTLNKDIKFVLDRLAAFGALEASKDPLEGLKEYQKYKLYKTAYMESFLWSITGKCNYKCRHCLLSAPSFEQVQLSLEDCKYIIKELETSGVSNVDISGGEPLVRQDFWQIADELSKAGIKVRTIFTNARLINEKFMEELDKRNMYPTFQISFDGTGFHDWLRGVEGAEKETIRAIKLLVQYNRNVDCTMCIHKKNKDSLRDTVKLLSELGVRSLNINAPQCLGCWADYSQKYALSEEEEIEVIKEYIPQYFEDNAPINISIDGYFSGYKGRKEFLMAHIHNVKSADELSKMYICKTARFKSYISPEGKIMPCMGFSGSSLTDKFPNILEKSLAEITTDSFYKDIVCTTKTKFLEKNEECKTCEHLLHCAGGCSACALNDTGDYCGVEIKHCNFFKKNLADEIRKAVPEGIIEI
ncbi:radical SAM additional 4Fe4S-binding SPASM domain-containing protein [Eubacterium ruminantium]|nr:radical SAM additional 4Fe4S-binding SPASM domain-containing protein [Eubacterium ruminantium]